MGNYMVLEGNNVEIHAQPRVVKTVNNIGLSSGHNSLVAAVTGKKIRVISMVMFVESTGQVTLENGSGGTGLMVAGSVTIGNTFIFPVNQFGWAETAAGVALFANVTGTTNSISLRYVEV